MKDMEVTVIENREVIKDHFLLKAKVKGRIPAFRPGQFVMVKIQGPQVFLRRPFTAYECEKDTISILYKVKGVGTRVLSKMKRGEKTFILGPCGRGFSITERELYVVIAGGIGVAGVNLLIKSLKKNVWIFFGTSSSSNLSLLGNLTNYDLFISTLDGTYGKKGDVISLFREKIDDLKNKDVEIFACGPKEMYKSLKDALLKYRLPCQVLYEERMACGMGLCFGCVVETLDPKDPIKRVCYEGPVFSLWELSL
ncbi:MAG: dihydroorotate dehydrogenase electron transfer subunit [Desulfobacterota bacterium]|nr:dihydroorotate dehydrogenase electron transfer subunit [Thermodesulfobacteriota bacterium]MDW8001373.1 dihydroorotate dehydrogenase electron transfer subunit [Deltaproteobacteria bacterium]